MIANTIAQCLRLAGCALRDLDIREITTLNPTASPSTTHGCAIVLFESIAGGSGHLYDMLHGLDKRWWKEAAKILDVGKGDDSERERRMLRRIVTADSPTNMGVPEYDPINAERVLNAILSGTTLEDDSESEETTPPLPKPDLEKLKQYKASKMALQLPKGNVRLSDLANSMPREFTLWFTNDSPATPLAVGSHHFVRQPEGTTPDQGQVVILRNEALKGGVGIGKWQTIPKQKDGKSVTRVTRLILSDDSRVPLDLVKDQLETLEWAALSDN